MYGRDEIKVVQVEEIDDNVFGATHESWPVKVGMQRHAGIEDN